MFTNKFNFVVSFQNLKKYTNLIKKGFSPFQNLSFSLSSFYDLPPRFMELFAYLLLCQFLGSPISPLKIAMEEAT